MSLSQLFSFFIKVYDVHRKRRFDACKFWKFCIHWSWQQNIFNYKGPSSVLCIIVHAQGIASLDRGMPVLMFWEKCKNNTDCSFAISHEHCMQLRDDKIKVTIWYQHCMRTENVRCLPGNDFQLLSGVPLPQSRTGESQYVRRLQEIPGLPGLLLAFSWCIFFSAA